MTPDGRSQPMALFKIDGPGEVGVVGDGGETLGPFKADKNGVIDVPDDFQEAIVALSRAAGVKPHRPKKESD